jgi:hypothetical protein
VRAMCKTQSEAKRLLGEHLERQSRSERRAERSRRTLHAAAATGTADAASLLQSAEADIELAQLQDANAAALEACASYVWASVVVNLYLLLPCLRLCDSGLKLMPWFPFYPDPDVIARDHTGGCATEHVKMRCWPTHYPLLWGRVQELGRVAADRPELRIVERLEEAGLKLSAGTPSSSRAYRRSSSSSVLRMSSPSSASIGASSTDSTRTTDRRKAAQALPMQAIQLDADANG